tara:strand:- start:425 stop:541 length:117 start_codon:yes stop_codon:yes gene_type:complete
MKNLKALRDAYVSLSIHAKAITWFVAIIIAIILLDFAL